MSRIFNECRVRGCHRRSPVIEGGVCLGCRHGVVRFLGAEGAALIETFEAADVTADGDAWRTAFVAVRDAAAAVLYPLPEPTGQQMLAGRDYQRDLRTLFVAVCLAEGV